MSDRQRFRPGPQDPDRPITRLFFRMLPVQVGIMAMGAVNAIIDGVVAARVIGPDAVAVVGLYYTMCQVLSAGSGVLLGGVAILSGRDLGSGKIKEARGICTLGLFLALIFGAVRSLILNRILLSCAGSDGLSALSTFNMISGLIIAVALGTGSLIRMLCSVFIGEQNSGAVKAAVKCALTKVMLIIVGIGVLEVIFAPMLTGIFYPDPATRVYELTRQLIFIYGFCLPLMFACLVFYNYAQALRHRIFVNIISVVDALISLLIPALILGPLMGALGVWLSFAIGLVITLAVYLIYPRIRLKRWPKTADEWLLLPEDMEEKERLVMNVENMEQVASTSARVQAFCEEHGMDEKTSAFAGLCLEEMVGNIVRHGFTADQRDHDLEVRVMAHENKTVLRIKDDCVPFDPKEWLEMTSGKKAPLANVGIRLVYGIAKQVDYQNLLGMNVLTITL